MPKHLHLGKKPLYMTFDLNFLKSWPPPTLTTALLWKFRHFFFPLIYHLSVYSTSAFKSLTRQLILGSTIGTIEQKLLNMFFCIADNMIDMCSEVDKTVTNRSFHLVYRSDETDIDVPFVNMCSCTLRLQTTTNDTSSGTSGNLTVSTHDIRLIRYIVTALSPI